VTVTLNKKKANMVTDEEIIEHHIFERVKRGCVECGNNDFGYQAGVKEENNLKWIYFKFTAISVKRSMKK
tara:strand:- start:114 stop:323 length:210 start_codon:yes stop_codon:yes gene_type:complete